MLVEAGVLSGCVTELVDAPVAAGSALIGDRGVAGDNRDVIFLSHLLTDGVVLLGEAEDGTALPGG